MTEEQKETKKEFRKYLRTEKSIKSSFLNSLMDAMDNHLPSILQLFGIALSSSIYEDRYSYAELQGFLDKINSDESILAGSHGYATSLSLQYYIEYFCVKHNVSPSQHNTVPLTEGEEAEFKGVRYERNEKARKKCIEHYGCRCFVCGFDFEKTYGELGKGFIEVHHIVPVSQRGGEYVVDPIRDLRPLCSNCHSMVHQQGNIAMNISDLEHIISSNREE